MTAKISAMIVMTPDVEIQRNLNNDCVKENENTHCVQSKVGHNARTRIKGWSKNKQTSDRWGRIIRTTRERD